MAAYSYFAPNLDDIAVRIDEKGRARDTHVSSSEILFLLPNAIILAYRAALVRHQCKGQIIFAFEFIVTGNAILGDADNFRIAVGKPLLELSEFAGFLDAARRLVLREKAIALRWSPDSRIRQLT